jgi:heme-degrading monooxygenase HmoA
VGGNSQCGDNREVLVISAWSSGDDWKIWGEGQEWKELKEELAPNLGGPVKLRVFMPGAEYAKQAA